MNMPTFLVTPSTTITLVVVLPVLLFASCGDATSQTDGGSGSDGDSSSGVEVDSTGDPDATTGESSGGDDCEDQDGDGHCAGDGSGLDCDDSRPDVGPNAAERCDDVDNNCDGAVDEGVRNACGTCGDGCVTFRFADAVLDGVLYDEEQGLVIPPADLDSAWFIDQNGSRVRRLDDGEADGQPVYAMPPGWRAHALASDFVGNAWVLALDSTVEPAREKIFRIQSLGCTGEACVHPPLTLQHHENKLTGLVVDLGNDLWAFGPAALYHVSSETLAWEAIPSDVPMGDDHGEIRHATIAADGSMWLLNQRTLEDHRLTRFDPKTRQFGESYPVPVQDGISMLDALAVPDGSVWIASDTGLFRLRPGEDQLTKLIDGDFARFPFYPSLAVTPDGDILAIQALDQIVRVDSVTAATELVAADANGCHWRSVAADAAGNIYAYASNVQPVDAPFDDPGAKIGRSSCNAKIAKIDSIGTQTWLDALEDVGCSLPVWYPEKIESLHNLNIEANPCARRVRFPITACPKERRCAEMFLGSPFPDRIDRYEHCYAANDMSDEKEANVARCRPSAWKEAEGTGLLNHEHAKPFLYAPVDGLSDSTWHILITQWKNEGAPMDCSPIDVWSCNYPEGDPLNPRCLSQCAGFDTEAQTSVKWQRLSVGGDAQVSAAYPEMCLSPFSNLLGIRFAAHEVYLDFAAEEPVCGDGLVSPGLFVDDGSALHPPSLAPASYVKSDDFKAWVSSEGGEVCDTKSPMGHPSDCSSDCKALRCNVSLQCLVSVRAGSDASEGWNECAFPGRFAPPPPDELPTWCSALDFQEGDDITLSVSNHGGNFCPTGALKEKLSGKCGKDGSINCQHMCALP